MSSVASSYPSAARTGAMRVVLATRRHDYVAVYVVLTEVGAPNVGRPIRSAGATPRWAGPQRLQPTRSSCELTDVQIRRYHAPDFRSHPEIWAQGWPPAATGGHLRRGTSVGFLTNPQLLQSTTPDADFRSFPAGTTQWPVLLPLARSDSEKQRVCHGGTNVAGVRAWRSRQSIDRNVGRS